MKIFEINAKGNAIADAWGPAVTKIIKDQDMEALQALCEPTVNVTLSTNDEGGTATFTVGEQGDLDWQDLMTTFSKDIEDNYAQTESACLGVLGNRMILEVGRVDTNDELYMNSCSVLTLSDNGKIVALESFASSIAPHVLDAAQAAKKE